jgi:hypothetical protein
MTVMPESAAVVARGMGKETLQLGIFSVSPFVHFFHEAGLDNVSCSPFRVPVARLEARRAAVSSSGSDTR